jgi:protein-disulfide isomerase
MASSKAHRVQAPRTRPVKTRKRPAAPRIPSSRRSIYIAAIAAAAAVAAILIGISVAGGSSGGRNATSNVTVLQAAETAALLRGIPQHGTTLGSPGAPVKLVEYADLQCTYCGHWARDVFPTLVARYVRTGTVQLEFRGMAFVGPDSAVALRTALAAAPQNRLWNVVELLYRNQGAENSGWVNDTFVRAALARVPGIDPSQVLSDRDSTKVAALAQRSADQAQAVGVNATPTFEIAKKGAALERLEVGALDVPSFTGPIDELLAR